MWTYACVARYLPDHIDHECIFLEIGSDRGEHSTQNLAQLAKDRGLALHTVDIEFRQFDINNVVFHQARGSAWCRQELPLLQRCISLVYLDNFDWVWDCEMLQEGFESCQWNRQIYRDLQGPDWPQHFTPWHLLNLDLQSQIIQDFGRRGRDLEDFKRISQLKLSYQEQHGLVLDNNQCQIEHLTQIINILPWLSPDAVLVFDDTFHEHGSWTGKCGPAVTFLQSMGFSVLECFPNGVCVGRSASG